MPQKRSNPVIKRKGKEYVSMEEFCTRKDTKRWTVMRYIKLGKISSIKINGVTYIDWESNSHIWDSEHMGKPLNGSGRKRKENTTGKQLSIKPVETVREPVEPDVGDDIIAELSDGKDTYQIEKIDMSQFSDCYKRVYTDNGSTIATDDKGNPIMDWQLFDQRARAMIHYQQYQTKNGELIPKEEVNAVLGEILIPLKNDIMQIPERYASQFLACLERAKINVPNALNTELRKILADTSEKLLKDMIKHIEEHIG